MKTNTFDKIRDCSEILNIIGNIIDLYYSTGESKLKQFAYLIDPFKYKFQDAIDSTVNLKETPESSVDRFDIEQQIFACWNIIDDYEFVLRNTTAPADHDYFLGGVIPMYRLRFEILLDQKRNFHND